MSKKRLNILNWVKKINKRSKPSSGVAETGIPDEHAEKKFPSFEERYKTLFENSLDAIYMFDFTGKFLDANPAALRLLGYANEDISHLNFASLIDSDQLEKALYVINKMLVSDLLPELQEYRLKHKDGHYIWIETQASMIYRDGDNGVALGVARDITKRKKAEEALQKSEVKYRHLVENAKDIIFTCDIEGNCSFMNHFGLDKLGYTLEEIVEKNYIDLIPAEYIEKVNNFYMNQFKENIEETYFELPMHKKDGGIIWFGQKVKLVNNDGKYLFYSISRDITERKKTEEELQESEERWGSLVQNIPDIIIIVSHDLNILTVNQSSIKSKADELKGENILDFVASGYSENVRETINKVFQTRESDSYIILGVGEQGPDSSWYETRIVPIIKEDRVDSVMLISTDITDRRHAEEALRNSEERYRSLYDNALAGMITVQLDNRKLIGINELGYRMFGYSSRDEILGKDIIAEKHIDARTRDKIVNWLREKGEIYSHETPFKRNDGSIFWGEVSARIYPDENKIEGIIIDITKRKKAEEQIHDLTYYDQLTRLPNRDKFRTSIQKEIMKAEMKKKGNIFAVMCLGIDRFKNINNIYGTETGDSLIKEVAGRLKMAVYENDVVARFEGDKFMILFSNIASRDDAGDLVRKTGSVFSNPFDVADEKIKITSSMGICLYPRDGEAPELLIKNSEAAMYNAKLEGLSTHFFDAELNDRILYQFQLENELQSAIDNGEFIIHYQPRVGVQNGNNGDYVFSIDGMESLIRWDSPKRGLVPPFHFIPLAEKTGMIVDIGYDILRKSCEQNKMWQNMGYCPIRVAVNLSPFQFSQPDLVANIEKITKEVGLDPEWLELEITESGIMQNEEKNIEKLIKLREKGFSIAIDDFGTGYSSLSKLQYYPIDTLKIDKSFIDNIVSNEKTAAITKYIINLARDLGFSVIAEGVETKEQIDFLLAHKCNQIQGFYYSKPLPSDEFEKKLN